ncbi:MAG: ABC transporter substrate-binding protein, partial [Polyangiaceae bacterium]
PTLAQISNGIPVKLIGYQYDFELRIEAAPGINSFADLKGKKFCTPFGTTAYEFSVNTMREQGLAASDLINVAPTDLGTAISGGQISAMTIWDPLWGIIEATYHTKPLAKAFHTGFVLGRADFVQNEREATVKYLEAQMLAIAFRANNKEEADKRYLAAFNIPLAAAQAAESIDRDYNWKNPEQVSLELQNKDYQDLAEVQKFALGAKLIPHEVDVKAQTDMSLWREALARLKASKITISQIHYISNAK